MMLGGKAIKRSPAVEYLGSAYDTTAGANFSVDVSSIDIQAGDLGILFVVDADRSDSFTVSGWSEVIPSNTANAREGSIWTKTMAGGETTVASSSYVGSEGIITAAFFRNAELLDYETAESSVASPTAAPNPPNMPTGFDSGDALYIAGMCEGSGSTISTIPQMNTAVIQNGTNVCSGVGYAVSTVTLASFDPLAFTGTFTTARYIAHILLLGAL